MTCAPWAQTKKERPIYHPFQTAVLPPLTARGLRAGGILTLPTIQAWGALAQAHGRRDPGSEYR
jgi:hypothetical protein